MVLSLGSEAEVLSWLTSWSQLRDVPRAFNASAAAASSTSCVGAPSTRLSTRLSDRPEDDEKDAREEDAPTDAAARKGCCCCNAGPEELDGAGGNGAGVSAEPGLWSRPPGRGSSGAGGGEASEACWKKTSFIWRRLASVDRCTCEC